MLGHHQQAEGATHQWSEIDVLVVSPRFDAPRRRQDVDLLWQVAARTDSRIEPIPCGAGGFAGPAQSDIIIVPCETWL